MGTVQRAFRAKYAKDPLTDKPFVRGINNLLKLGVSASRKQVVAHSPLKVMLNGFEPVFCIVRTYLVVKKNIKKTLVFLWL